MTLKLSTPNEFTAFPFLPYEIQLRLMQHLYEAIENEKVTIVESPTGTVRIPSWYSLMVFPHGHSLVLTTTIIGKDLEFIVRISDMATR